METFYQYLSTAHQQGDLYLERLAAITRASHDQLQALASDLAWQAWDGQTAGS